MRHPAPAGGGAGGGGGRRPRACAPRAAPHFPLIVREERAPIGCREGERTCRPPAPPLGGRGEGRHALARPPPPGRVTRGGGGGGAGCREDTERKSAGHGARLPPLPFPFLRNRGGSSRAAPKTPEGRAARAGANRCERVRARRRDGGLSGRCCQGVLGRLLSVTPCLQHCRVRSPAPKQQLGAVLLPNAALCFHNSGCSRGHTTNPKS